jgi:outer membrane receptor protein involved in Fe transport
MQKATPPAYSSRVRADPQRSAGSTTIEAKTIALTPLRGTDDLLRLVPGLLLSRHGAEGKSGQIFLRGFDAVHGSDVEVTVAGIPLNELSNVHGQGYLDLGVVVPEAVRRIDVKKGSFFLEQGPFATAGTVALTLGVAAESRGARLAFEGGSFFRERLAAVVSPRNLDERTVLAVEAVRDDGFGVNRQSERLAGVAQALLWTREHAGAIEAFVMGHAGRFGEPGVVPSEDVAAGRIGFYGSYTPWQEGSAARLIGGVRYRRDHHLDTLELTLFGGWRRLALEENFTGALISPRGDTRLQRHDAAQVGLRTSYLRRLTRGLTLALGADLGFERIGQREDRLDAARSFLRTRDLDADQATFDVRVGLRWAPRPWVRAEAGLRVDGFVFDVLDRLAAMGERVQGLFAAPSPRVTLTFPLPRGFTLFCAYGRGVRPPEARALTTAPRAPDRMSLPNEFKGGPAALSTSDAVEVGARWALRDRLVVNVAGFVTLLSNEVVFDHVSGINVALNATRRPGVEVALQGRPWRWLELRADLSWVDARFVESGAPIPGAPTVLLQAQANVLDLHGFSAGVRLVYVAPRPLAFGAVASSYAVVDARAGYRWGPLEVGLSILNLANSQWKEGEFHFASAFDPSTPPSSLPRLHFAAGPPIAVRAGLTLWI